MSEKNEIQALSGFDGAKRATLRRMVTAAAFVVPVVSSFSIDSITVSTALAGNGTITLVPTATPTVTGS